MRRWPAVNTVLAFLTSPWSKAAALRAVRTAAQVAILVLGGDAVSDLASSGGIDIVTAPWLLALRYAAGGAALSLLFSVKGLPEVK